LPEFLRTGHQGATVKGIDLNSRPGEPPAQFPHKIRAQWSVKNKNHHPRDATLLGDKCRRRTRNTAANLALLGGVTLMIRRKAEPDRSAADLIRSNQRNSGTTIALIK
jgi:hypothetical protein